MQESLKLLHYRGNYNCMYSYLFSVNFRLTSSMLWPGSGKSNDVIKGNACIKCTMTVTLKNLPLNAPKACQGTNEAGSKRTSTRILCVERWEG